MRLNKLPLAIVLLLLILLPMLVSGEDSLVGKPAPEFKMQDQNGDWHTLENYKGKWLALYFYPKNDTPGCTTEACNFRDNIYAYKAIGAAVVGVSLDDVASHAKFASKYKLPFTLLSDADGSLSKAYHVLRDYKLIKIAARQSFLINPQGVIVKHYEKVDPETHSEEVLEALKQLMAEAG
ncbi:MAG: peroxiredoxin [Xanthomonadales bacterium]|nr:peroxiredoxin [Xanthomonadales bacterium]